MVEGHHNCKIDSPERAAPDDVLEAEVHNYVEAAELAFEWVPDKPITSFAEHVVSPMTLRAGMDAGTYQ